MKDKRLKMEDAAKGKAMLLTSSLIMILVLCAMQLQAITIETIVEEMNARYAKIMEKAGSIRITQSIKSLSNGDEVDSKQIILKKDKRYKIETIPDLDIDREKIASIILFDGENVWFISPFAGKALMPKDRSMLQGMFEDFSKLIPFSSTLAKDEIVRNEECFVLQIPEESGNILRKIWISKTRFVPVKATAKFANQVFLLNFAEYKKIYGIWGIPYRTEVFLGGKPASIITIDEVELDIDLEEKVFDINSH